MKLPYTLNGFVVLALVISVQILWCFAKKGSLTIKFKHRLQCKHKAMPGDKLAVYYTASSESGEMFYDSKAALEGKPYNLTLGHRDVVRGWESGMHGMCEGEKRELSMPPEMAWGKAGSPERNIPGNVPLVFDIELVKLEKMVRDEL